MSLYPLERWTGGAIPIFLHWVLAAFILVLGAYHRRSFLGPVARSLAVRLTQSAAWLVVVGGVLIWVGYQLTPTILAAMLDARRPEHAVRIDRGVAMTTSDGVKLVFVSNPASPVPTRGGAIGRASCRERVSFLV